mmetsp:Transcript_30407/g.83259  ORF Transcript_30407/g.83259 Transcript_30407/m.83259 type:complete len:203 (-) Transcript_30407:576-1184(-)
MLSLTSASALALHAPLAAVPTAQRAAAAPLMAMENELGATGPLGYWDPLGFSTKQPERFARYRAVELKHGRIAMAACTGYFVQSVLRWPGYLSTSAGVKFSDLPNGIAGFAKIPPLGLAQIFLFIGLMEAFTWPFYQGGLGKVPEGKLPGDVAGDLWVRYSDPEVKKHKLNVEINNGRAAMMGSLGMLMHDHILGTWIPPGF